MAVKKTATCLHCGKKFTPVRSTARYCSDAHRVAHNRSGKAGLTEEEVLLLEAEAARTREFDGFLAEARRIYDAEVEAIRLRMRGGDIGAYPVDYEELLERAERKFIKKLHTWEPEAIRKRRPARKS